MSPTVLRRTLHGFVSAVMGLAICLMAGCAAAPKRLEGVVPGRTLDTLNSAVSIAAHNVDKSTGGRGYLLFRSPDRLHVVLLSPFGQALLEIFSEGDRLTCLLPAKGVAYSGLIEELPDRDGLRSWGLLRWVVERPPPPGPALYREHLNRDGVREKVYYDTQGLVSRKETENGDLVQFLDYSVVDGVPVAGVIEISTAAGELVRLTFSEPEVNQPLDDSMLTPNLEGIKVLPFSAFKELPG